MKKLMKRIASTHLKAIQACPPDESEPEKSLAELVKKLTAKAFEAGRLYGDGFYTKDWVYDKPEEDEYEVLINQGYSSHPNFDDWFNQNFS